VHTAALQSHLSYFDDRKTTELKSIIKIGLWFLSRRFGLKTCQRPVSVSSRIKDDSVSSREDLPNITISSRSRWARARSRKQLVSLARGRIRLGYDILGMPHQRRYGGDTSLSKNSRNYVAQCIVGCLPDNMRSFNAELCSSGCFKPLCVMKGIRYA